MRTVIYFEVLRRRKKICSCILLPVIVWSLLFLALNLLDQKIPVINSQYMMWPDMLKSFLGMPAWNHELAVNVWHFLALYYPIFWCGMIMKEVSCSVAEEERLETVVYLQNAGVRRSSIWLAKGVVWILVSWLSLAMLLFVQMIEFWLAGMSRYYLVIAEYYVLLCLISFFYLIAGLFVSSYAKGEEHCAGAAWTLVLVPWLLARIPALLRFLSDLLIETGRQGEVQEILAVWGQKIEPLSMICPLTWCWYSVEVKGVFVIAAVVVAGILGGAGISIYKARRC